MSTNDKYQLILASNSPRRREILRELGFDFRIITPNASEPECQSVKEVQEISKFKAHNVAEQIKNYPWEMPVIIIAADTIVALDGVIYGKPANSEEAFQTLRKLSGKEHQVVTAISILILEENNIIQEINSEEVTNIEFRELSEAEINNYIENHKPFDKAGSYAIQETASLFIKSINGCYSNVVGLPVTLLTGLLEKVR